MLDNNNICLEDILTLQDRIVSDAVHRHRLHEQTGGLEALLKVLDSIGPNGQDLIPKILEHTANRGIVSAIPTHEPVNMAASALHDAAMPVIGVDGSQIYPSDTEPVWGYVRAVAYETETGLTEQLGQFIDYDKVVNKDGYPLKNATDAWRDALEMSLLAKSAAIPGWEDRVLLLDGSLLPWAIGKELEEPANLHRSELLKARGRLVASVISMPNSNYLLNLIRGKIGEAQGTIHDWVLASKLLKDGERSAIFVHGSPQNKELPPYAEIHMFYLRAGDQIMRVEIPTWVACDPDAVAHVHASILEDCLIGYPISLMGAHSQVRIQGAVSEELKERIIIAFAEKTGVLPAASMKDRFKSI